MPRFDTDWNEDQVHILQALTIVSSVLSLLGTFFITYSYMFIQTGTPFSKRRTKKKKKKIILKMQELEKSRKLHQPRLTQSLQLQIQTLEQELQSIESAPQDTESFLRFNRFVYYLSGVHLANAIVWILLIALHNSQNELYCEILAPLNVYLFGCSFGWTILIATEICYRFTHTTVSLFGETIIPESISGVKEIWFHLFAWVLPFVVVIAPIAQREFGRGVWSCWVHDPDDVWVYIFGVIVALTMLYCTSAYIYVTVVFRQRLEMSGTLGEAERRKAVFLQTRVSTYLLVFLLCWLPAFIRNIVGIWNPPADTPLFVLTAVGAFFLPLNGFLDSLVYGITRPLWEKVWAHIQQVCCCCWWCCYSKCCTKSGYEEIEDEGCELAIQDNDEED